MADKTTFSGRTEENPPQTIREIYQKWGHTSEPVLEAASHIVDRVEELDLEATDVLLALEIVRLESDCTDRERLALFYTILASIVAKRRGSVRFNIANEGGVLADRLSRNLPGVTPRSVTEGDDRGSTEPSGWKPMADLVNDFFDSPGERSVLGSPGEAVPLIVEDDQLYHQRTFAEENRLAGSVQERMIDDFSGSMSIDVPFTYEDVADGLEVIDARSSFQLTPRQQYGVLTALCTPLSVITGGPGTGKTFIVITILRLLTELDVSPDEIGIAAPTGKAANRLGETISQELEPTDNARDREIADTLRDPSTLHRLLGYSEKREEFYYHENRPLPFKYVLVDEASMIDLSLMDQLFSAVGKDSSLCLLGDANQLPAVESGAVFRDLVPNKVCTDVPWRDLAVDPLEADSTSEDEPLSRQSVRLEKNFRVDTGGSATKNLLSVSEELNRGGEDLEFVEPTEGSDGPIRVQVRRTRNDITFEGVEIVEPGTRHRTGSRSTKFSGTEFEQILQFWYKHWYGSQTNGSGGESIAESVFTFRDGEPSGSRDALERIFRSYNQRQLLSVTRRTPFGSREINQFLHRHHRNQLGDSGTSDVRNFEPGEPVIMNHNDYDRNLFNGDQGIILKVKQERTGNVKPMAVFPGIESYRTFYLGPLRSHLSHAFALTIHKSQGSEFGHVAIVLPGRDVPHFTRELLYTGVTRARQSITFLGSRDMLKTGASKRDERNSGLLERLE